VDTEKTFRHLLSLSWQSAAYGVGVFGQQAVAYLTLPVLTKYLSRTDYGVVSVLIALLSFINVISNAGLPAATFRMYNEDDHPSARTRVLGTSQVLFFGYALLMTAVVLGGAEYISLHLLGNTIYVDVIRIVGIYLVASTLINYGNIILRIHVRPLQKSVHNILWLLAEYGLVIGLVVFMHLGIKGYWLGRLIGGFVALAGMWWLVHRFISWQISMRQFREIVRYALPMFPATMALWALRLVDRALITTSVGLNEVAIYEVGYKIGLLTGMVNVPFLAAWPQFAFSSMKKRDAPRIYRDVLTSVAAGSLFLGLGVIMFRDELVIMFSTSEYARASTLVPWIVLSQIAWALHPVLSLGPKIKRNTTVLAWVTGVAAFMNIALNLFLIPRIGILGAAIATFVAYTILVILEYVIGRSYFPFPLDWSRLGKLSLAGLGVYCFAFLLESVTLSPWFSFGMRMLTLGVGFPTFLLLLRFVSWKQIRQMATISLSVLQNRFNCTSP